MFINILNGLLVLDIGMNGLRLALWSTLIIDISIEFIFAIAIVWLAFSVANYLIERRLVKG